MKEIKEKWKGVQARFPLEPMKGEITGEIARTLFIDEDGEICLYTYNGYVKNHYLGFLAVVRREYVEVIDEDLNETVALFEKKTFLQEFAKSGLSYYI